MKKVIIGICILLFSNNLMAEELTKSNSASYSDFLDYRKKIISSKGDNWRLSKETREIAAKQKWPKNKLEQGLKEVKEFEAQLKSFKTEFSDFNDDEKIRLETISSKISLKSRELESAIQIQDDINKIIKNLRDNAANARNKTRELLAVQVNSESLYRQKYGNDFPATALEVIEARLKTQEQLSEIFNIDNQIDEIARIQAMGYSFIPQNDQEYYEPKKILQNLQEIDVNLKKILEKTSQDLKTYKRRMLAISNLITQ